MSDIEDEGAEEKEEEIPKIQITKETVSQSLTEIGKIFGIASLIDVIYPSRWLKLCIYKTNC
jgi:hypothetical protein